MNNFGSVEGDVSMSLQSQLPESRNTIGKKWNQACSSHGAPSSLGWPPKIEVAKEGVTVVIKKIKATNNNIIYIHMLCAESRLCVCHREREGGEKNYDDMAESKI